LLASGLLAHLLLLLLGSMQFFDFALVFAGQTRIALALEVFELGLKIEKALEPLRINLTLFDGGCHSTSRLSAVTAITKTAVAGQTCDLGKRFIQ
jgi:hypothetical protein